MLVPFRGCKPCVRLRDVCDAGTGFLQGMALTWMLLSQTTTMPFSHHRAAMGH